MRILEISKQLVLYLISPYGLTEKSVPEEVHNLLFWHSSKFTLSFETLLYSIQYIELN